MKRAADEPQYAAPAAQRLGYLRHMIANLEIASPDTLHGAAHLAPLAGLDLPVLDILADMNDAAIEAGAAADLALLARVRRLSSDRLVTEADRLAEEVRHGKAAPEGSREEILALLALRGEIMTAEILLSADPPRTRSIASRLADVAEIRGAHIPALARQRVREAIDMLRSNATAITASLRALLDAVGVSPLDAP